MQITSVQNLTIKNALLLREAKERKASGLVLVDGERELRRALEAGAKLEQLFFRGSAFKDLTAKAKEAFEVSQAVMRKLSYGQREETVLGVVRPHVRSLKEIKLSVKPLVVVLESLEKPGNLGAVLRTCDAVGVDLLIVCDAQTDVYNPNVVRASTGTVFSLPVVVTTNEEAADFLKKNKVRTFAAFPDAAKTHTQADLSVAAALVLGREDTGLSDFWARHADLKVKLPMRGQADSLNVSITAAVLLYEALRQRSG